MKLDRMITGLLVLFVAMYCNGVSARYISSDPIGLAGGTNTYAYVNNNPVNRIDPSGLIVEFNGPEHAVKKLQKSYENLKTTSKGRELCGILEQSPDTYLITNTFLFNIPGLKPGRAFYHDYSKTITVDPTYHPNLNTTNGYQPAPTTVILGHEIGHAATGIGDDGSTRMDNVNANENPIRQELGLPERTTYP